MPDIDDYPVLTGDAASDDYVLGFDVSDHSTSLDGRTKLFPVESLPTGVQVAGDIGGTVSAPEVTGTHLSEPLPVGQGGTGESSLGALGTAMGLGSAALQPTSAFDASGAAASAQTTAETYAAGLVSTETTRAQAAEALLLPKSGGTMSGPLVISDVPSPASPSSLPVGQPGTSSANSGLQVVSSYPSDDVTGGTDGTGRLLLYSYQRANQNLFGETIRNFLMRWDAKAMVAWYGPTGGSSGNLTANYDVNGNAAAGTSFQPWTWAGSHYESNDHSSIHGHWEVECPDTTGALQGRLIVPFVDDNPNSPVYGQIGVTKANVRLNQADLTMDSAWGVIRVGGTAGVNDRVFELASSIYSSNTTAVRWRIVANNTAESGSNVGSDFAIRRFSDTGTMLGTGLFISWATGAVALGNASPGIGQFTVDYSGSGNHGIEMVPAANTGSNAAYHATMYDSTSRFLLMQIAGEANSRFLVDSTGMHSWGAGATARDTNLYREGTALLQTDGSLTLNGTSANLTVGGAGHFSGTVGIGATPGSYALQVQSTTAGQMLLFERNTTSDSSPLAVFLAGDTSTAQAIGVSVVGDTSNRFGIDPNGKQTWGSGSAARDTTLARTAAGTLTLTGALAVTGGVTGVSGQFACAPNVYAPATQTLATVSSTTLAAWSSGSVCTNSFAAPASGKVLVTASFAVQAGTAGHDIMLALAALGTVTPVTGNTVTFQAQAASVVQPVCAQFLVSGLTPGSSYQFDLLGAVTSSDSAVIYAYGATGTALGSKGAPVVMTVQAI